MSRAQIDLDRKVFEEIKLVVFSLNDGEDKLRFGINAHKAKEVVEVDSIEPLPSMYRPYVGILNLRGLPVPILDMANVLGHASCSSDDLIGTRIIVCETLGKTVGIVADTPIKMFEFEDSSISPVSFAHGKIKQEYLVGLIESEGGYIFMLNIESVLDELDDDDKTSNSSPMVRYRGKRILIVEDSSLFRKKLGGFLEKLGVEVTLTTNGVEGLEVLEADDNFDLIFSDIEMPLMNGIEMVRKVRSMANLSHIPIVFHSSISNPELMNQIKLEELGDYITKFNEVDILTKLKIHLNT